MMLPINAERDLVCFYLVASIGNASSVGIGDAFAWTGSYRATSNCFNWNLIGPLFIQFYKSCLSDNKNDKAEVKIHF
jgi:hypothetical protein